LQTYKSVSNMIPMLQA